MNALIESFLPPATPSSASRAPIHLAASSSAASVDVAELEMAQHIDRHPWSASLLGPRAAWPSLLEDTVRQVLVLPTPAMILWGLDLVQIFNDGYRLVLGSRFPSALGQPANHSAPEGWAANWDTYRAIFTCKAGSSLLERRFACPNHAREHRHRSKMSFCAIRDEAGVARGILIGSSAGA